MAGPGVFHVEFGINETKLTQLLERRRYAEADALIRENTNPSYLDEGCYQRTPLYIALCGMDQDESHTAPRNLHLARLLVEMGASVNYRVPATYFGSEYMSPGKTALELVVEFYTEITKHSSHQPVLECGACWRLWDPIRHKVLGLDKQVVVDYEDIKQQLLDLVVIMLGQGGDCNLTDEFRMTQLHRSVVYSGDLSLTQLLVEHGADLNAVDIRGNTPLSALCDAFPLGINAYLEECPHANPYMDYNTLEDREDVFHYLLSQKGLKIDVQNKLGRTALFNCIVKGDVTSAHELLKLGCDTTLKGQVSEGGKVTREVSPLFASLCSNRMVRCHLDRYRLNLYRTPQFITHLVDAGFFQKSQITMELHEYLEEDFPDFQHLKIFGTKLLSLMFGGTSATLRQLSARAIFQRCLIQAQSPHPLLVFPKTLDPNLSLDDLDRPEEYMAYLCTVIDISVLENLVCLLGLPKDSLVYFEIELLRQRLFSKFRQFYWFKYYDEEVDEIYGGASDSDEIISDEDDSDLEYW